MQIYLLFAVIIAIIAVIFGLQNPVNVTVNFLFWKFEGSLALVLLITFGLGFITSLLTSLPGIIRRKKETLNTKRSTEESKKPTKEDEDFAGI